MPNSKQYLNASQCSLPYPWSWASRGLSTNQDAEKTAKAPAATATGHSISRSSGSSSSGSGSGDTTSDQNSGSPSCRDDVQNPIPPRNRSGIEMPSGPCRWRTLTPLWGDIGVLLGLYWGNIGVIQGVYWGYCGMCASVRVRRVFAPQLVGNKAREGKMEKIACERLSK